MRSAFATTGLAITLLFGCGWSPDAREVDLESQWGSLEEQLGGGNVAAEGEIDFLTAPVFSTPAALTPSIAAVPLAAMDLPEGRVIDLSDVIIQVVTKSELEEQRWPMEQVILGPKHIVGRSTNQPIERGQPFLSSSLSPPLAEQGTEPRIKPDPVLADGVNDQPRLENEFDRYRRSIWTHPPETIPPRPKELNPFEMPQVFQDLPSRSKSRSVPSMLTSDDSDRRSEIDWMLVDLANKSPAISSVTRENATTTDAAESMIRFQYNTFGERHSVASMAAITYQDIGIRVNEEFGQLQPGESATHRRFLWTDLAEQDAKPRPPSIEEDGESPSHRNPFERDDEALP